MHTVFVFFSTVSSLILSASTLQNAPVWPQVLSKLAATTQEDTVKDTNAPLASIMPYFKIKDWVAAAPIMQEFDHVSATTNQPPLEHGWMSKKDEGAGPVTVLRVSMHDPDKLMDFYIDELSPLIDKMLQNAATLERIELHGISSEDQERPYSEAFETEGWFSNLSSEKPFPKTALFVRPYYKIRDEEHAKPLMQRAMEETEKEKGILYFGWHREGNRAICHGIFQDGEAFTNHYQKLNSVLSELLAGPATLEKIEVHGYDAELRKVDETIKELKGVFKGVIVQEYSSETGEHAMYLREF